MEGHFGERRSIGLEDALFLPFCLIFLLYGNKIVSFFSLEIGLLANSKTRGKLFTYTLQLFGFGDCGILQAFAVASTAAILLQYMYVYWNVLGYSSSYKLPSQGTLSHKLPCQFFEISQEI